MLWLSLARSVIKSEIQRMSQIHMEHRRVGARLLCRAASRGLGAINEMAVLVCGGWVVATNRLGSLSRIAQLPLNGLDPDSFHRSLRPAIYEGYVPDVYPAALFDARLHTQ